MNIMQNTNNNHLINPHTDKQIFLDSLPTIIADQEADFDLYFISLVPKKKIINPRYGQHRKAFRQLHESLKVSTLGDSMFKQESPFSILIPKANPKFEYCGILGIPTSGRVDFERKAVKNRYFLKGKIQSEKYSSIELKSWIVEKTHQLYYVAGTSEEVPFSSYKIAQLKTKSHINRCINYCKKGFLGSTFTQDDINIF